MNERILMNNIIELAAKQAAATPRRPWGTVSLVGAGPGDPELLTVKALKRLQTAQVVLHDQLISPAVLALIPPTARRIEVGKRCGRRSWAQSRINHLLIALARRGLTVCRLKGGDPFLFGRGGEELDALRRAGIAVDVVPGITAAVGAAAACAMPLTHRDHAQGVTFITASRREDGAIDLPFRLIAEGRTTTVIYMGRRLVREIAAQLLEHGLAATTPMAVIVRATWPDQRSYQGSVATVADWLPPLTDDAALIVIGQVAAWAQATTAPQAHDWVGDNSAVARRAEIALA